MVELNYYEYIDDVFSRPSSERKYQNLSWTLIILLILTSMIIIFTI